MLALRPGADGSVQAVEVPIPEPAENEVLIRVLRAGICSTDLETLKGYTEFKGTLGHEFVGEVVKFGASNESDKFKLGDRVVGEININCGHCGSCAQGGVAKRNHCLARAVIGLRHRDGCFAQYIALPTENLYLVPECVSTPAATFAEPLAAAFRIVEQDLLRPGDKVAVLGDGKLGLLIAEVLSAQKQASELVVFGRHQWKMDLLPKEGIMKVVLTGDEDTDSRYDKYFDVVVEASGSPSGLMLASVLARPLATVVLKTTCAAGTRDFNTAPFVVKELKVVGSRCGNFSMALECLREKRIDVSKYITAVYPLSDGEQAIQHASQRGALKIQLAMVNKSEEIQVAEGGSIPLS